MNPVPYYSRVLPLFLAWLLPLSLRAQSALSPADLQFFESKVRPILSNHCLECHSAQKGKVKGGFNMDTKTDLLQGGDNGLVIKPGNPSESSLISAIEWSSDFQMPPKKKLAPEQIAILKEWIVRGAPDPRDGISTLKTLKKEHWAFQPVQKPPLPNVKNAAWCKNSIDRFVLAKLEEKGLIPANTPEIGTAAEVRFNKEALLRRACFDLVGLPPTLEQINAFTADPSPNAYEKVIDALLASPAYGERWARHWLDTARYSDTTGRDGMDFGKDYRFPYAWTYRDWVIEAINKDLPYDQFILNQIAADKIKANPATNLAALGFLTVGQHFKDKESVINDRIDTVTRGFLGLSVACARCHEHKFDPIKQADYYALHGVFSSIAEPVEKPVIGIRGKPEEIQKYNEDLKVIESDIYNQYYSFCYDLNSKLRQKIGAYLLSSWLTRNKNDAESINSGNKIATDEKLDSKLLEYFRIRHSNENDPIAGPFLKLIQKSASDKGGAPKKTKDTPKDNENPIVIAFLKEQSQLPNTLQGVGDLITKFYSEKIAPSLVATKENPRGVLYKEIENVKKIPSKPDRDLMALAVYPIELIHASEISLDKVKGVSMDCYPLTPNFQKAVNLTKLNEFILHAAAQPVRAMIVEDLPQPQDSPIYPRGNPPKKGAGENPVIVPRRFLEILTPNGKPTPFREGSGRLELAQAIANPQNPLTARVLVNRVWMYHFGEGLVKTPDDLGNNAGKPTHPELLDFLATWFMSDFGRTKPAWSVKALHKAIMLSSTYQQSSRTVHLERNQTVDSENAFLWHSNVRRLDFESFRDSLIAMANSLDYTMYGPPVNLVSEPFTYRRSVYGFIDRGNVPDLLSQFDVASPKEPNTKRASSVVPQQALFLMNSPFVISLAHKIANRPDIASVKNNDSASIQSVYRVVLQRTPNEAELRLATDFLGKQRAIQKQVEKTMAPIEAAATQKAEADVSKMQKEEGEKGRAALVNSGSVVPRITLEPLETLIQALMFSNSATYLH